MASLTSPSDNTGWGSIGTYNMRATGARFTRSEPVYVRRYYRAQWGQLNGRKSASQIRRGYRRYKRLHNRRLASKKKVSNTTPSSKKKNSAKRPKAQRVVEVVNVAPPVAPPATVVVTRSGRTRRAPARLDL